MKKPIREYKDTNGNIKIEELLNHSIVFNYSGDGTLHELKVSDTFTGYLKVGKWVRLDLINIHFVIESKREQSYNVTDIGDTYKKLKDYFDNNEYDNIPASRPCFPPNKYIIPDKWTDTGVTCSKCGLECKGTMGYCCPQPICPMGMGSPMCSTFTR